VFAAATYSEISDTQGITGFEITVTTRSRAVNPTQKPATHFCGRVLSEAILFEQGTLFDWTSQMKFDVISQMWKIGGR
jgi:hypothetical protein